MKETEQHEFVDHPFVDDDSCYDAWHGGLCGQPKDAPVHQQETEATGVRELAEKFVAIGWELSHAASSPMYGLCNDRSCWRCRLVDFITETERKMKQWGKAAK